MVNNKDCIDSSFWSWLENFVKANSSFSDVGILYNSKNLSKYDIKNVYMIKNLFWIINDYAKDNFISLKKAFFGGYYTIRVDNSYYDIGHSSSMSDNFYYCRVNNNPNSYIDYRDIVENNACCDKIVIQELLSDVKNRVIELKEMGLSVNDICNFIYNQEEICETKKKTSSI